MALAIKTRRALDLVAMASLRNLGRLLPQLGYGRCRRCRSPWWAVDERPVTYSRGRGQFALCTRCWNWSSLEERLDAHAEVTADQNDWPAIEQAVVRDSGGPLPS